MKKIIRVSTVPQSLNIFCRGQLKMLSEYYDVVAVSSPEPETDFNEMKQREGVRCIALPMERHISIIKDVKSLIAMICLLRREKPYIVHSMTPKAGLISMVAAWICRVPVRMHTYTGLVFPTATGLAQKILIFTDRVLCFCANYINPEGQGVAKDLKAFKITDKPLHIIGHGNVRGIDANYWNCDVVAKEKNFENKTILRTSLRHELGIGDNDFVFLFVGRLVGDKGINELVSAFSKLSGSYVQSKDGKITTLKLLLVGGYEKKLDVLKLETMVEIKQNKDIITVGSKMDVRPYYAISDLFVFPSYREGFPNTVLEAGAMGLPQIVTDINGSNEIIKDGLNGVIIQSATKSSIPSADNSSVMIGPSHKEFAERCSDGSSLKNKDSSSPMERALYNAMSWFVSHLEEKNRMANNARRMIIDRFEQKKLWHQLLEEYQKM